MPKTVSEAASIALKAIQETLEDAYHRCFQECCGRPGMECCGNPNQAWSKEDIRIMDTLGPVAKTLSAALAADDKRVSVPSRGQINQWMADAGWQNSSIRQADLPAVEKVVRAALAAKLAEAERDAERYRFIRDANRSDCITRELSLYAMETLDEYVDAAMEDEATIAADAAHEKEQS